MIDGLDEMDDEGERNHERGKYGASGMDWRGSLICHAKGWGEVVASPALVAAMLPET